jgi:hypothetical protein
VIDTIELDEIVQAHSPGPILAPGTTEVAKRRASQDREPPAAEAAGS